MKRRTVLATAASATLALTAGCTGGTGSETACPDSPTKIRNIDTNSNNRIAVVGTVTNTDEDNKTVTVTGDTGTLIITDPPGYPPEGECVRVDAIPQGCIGSGCKNGTYVQALNIYKATTTS